MARANLIVVETMAKYATHNPKDLLRTEKENERTNEDAMMKKQIKRPICSISRDNHPRTIISHSITQTQAYLHYTPNRLLDAKFTLNCDVQAKQPVIDSLDK